MLTGLFLKGSLIGFSIAMPVGPVGILCIQHSLRRGLLAGLVAGSGAALADAFFGCMAGFGVSMLSYVISSYLLWLQLLGACILSYFGIKIFKTKPAPFSPSEIYCSHRNIFFSTFVLTLTNPLTIVCFAAIYASLGISPPEDEFLPGIILTLGILLGAVIWWFLLTFGVTLINKRFQIQSSPLLNRVSGCILTGCGCLAMLSVLRGFLNTL